MVVVLHKKPQFLYTTQNAQNFFNIFRISRGEYNNTIVQMVNVYCKNITEPSKENPKLLDVPFFLRIADSLKLGKVYHMTLSL